MLCRSGDNIIVSIDLLQHQLEYRLTRNSLYALVISSSTSISTIYLMSSEGRACNDGIRCKLRVLQHRQYNEQSPKRIVKVSRQVVKKKNEKNIRRAFHRRQLLLLARARPIYVTMFQDMVISKALAICVTSDTSTMRKISNH